MPLRHVANVDDVGLRVHDGGEPAAQVVADRARGGLARLRAVHRRADHVRRVHDHHLDAQPGAGGERLRLSLVLGVGVRQAELPAAVDVVLGAGPVRRGRADPRDARGDHHAPDGLGGGRLHSDPRRERVDLPHPLGRARADEAGRVEDGFAAAKGPPQRAAIEHVRLDRLHLEAAEPVQPGLVAVGHPWRSVGTSRKAGDMRADETGGPGHADSHNFAGLGLFERSYTAQPTVTQCRFASPSQ
jgi:hypothetical protein